MSAAFASRHQPNAPRRGGLTRARAAQFLPFSQPDSAGNAAAAFRAVRH